MEKEIKDALNFTIGAIATVKSETEKFITKIEGEFKSLAAKGSMDNGELSVNLRKYAEEGMKGFQNLIGDLNKKVDEVKTKVASAK